MLIDRETICAIAKSTQTKSRFQSGRIVTELGRFNKKQTTAQCMAFWSGEKRFD